MRTRISGILALAAASSLWYCGGSTSVLGSDASTESGSGSGSSSSGSGSSSGSSSGGGGNCPACGPGDLCCNGVSCSVDAYNDPLNCGSCNHQCQGATPFCQQGMCIQTPCNGQPCPSGTTCCASKCCQSGDICCEFEGPQSYVGCYTPTAQQPSCPPGCNTCVSDRNVKRDIVPVDPQAVLEGIARVPVATWSYKSDDPSIHHMGPMAQDLYGAFGLGNTDKAYSPVDASGIAFAAIQALYERTKEQDARIEKLERENAALRRGKRP